MKLIKIVHDRCNEYDKCEYFVAPDSMTSEQISDVINLAQDAYLAAFAELERAMPVPEPHPSHIDQLKDDSLTVGEWKKQHAAAKVTRDEVQAKKRAVDLSFNKELAQFGIVHIHEVDFEKSEMEFTAIWGHHHGKTFNY